MEHFGKLKVESRSEAPTSEEDLRYQVSEAKKKNKTLVMINRLRDVRIQEQLLAVAKEHRSIFKKSPEEIMKDIRSRIDREELVTNIMPRRKASKSHFNALLDEVKIGLRLDKSISSNESMEYIEAHEKGHAIRWPLIHAMHLFENRALSTQMSAGLSKMARLRARAADFLIAGMWTTNLVMIIGPSAIGMMAGPILKSPYLFSAAEIYERMSQLKNYFGMEDSQEFTAAHLAYARKNYVKDAGVDNNMTEFFKVITKEREPEFLRIMNSFGV